MRASRAVLCLAWLLAACAVDAQQTPPDPWASVRFLLGHWRGIASGQAGEGTAARSYEFVLGGRYIHERNVSTYPPQEKNPKGEVHEHWSMLSVDRARRTIVLRQFHVEGFVNQYALNAGLSTPTKLVFDSESFENFSSQWRARETYEILGPDEFVETFELAAPGEPLRVYSRNHFRRARP